MSSGGGGGGGGLAGGGGGAAGLGFGALASGFRREMQLLLSNPSNRRGIGWGLRFLVGLFILTYYLPTFWMFYFGSGGGGGDMMMSSSGREEAGGDAASKFSTVGSVRLISKGGMEALAVGAIRNSSAGGIGVEAVEFGAGRGSNSEATTVREVVASTRGAYGARPRRSSVAFSSVVLNGVVAFVIFDGDGQASRCVAAGPAKGSIGVDIEAGTYFMPMAISRAALEWRVGGSLKTWTELASSPQVGSVDADSFVRKALLRCET